MKAQRELINTYQKEQEFIQSQINKIRNSVEDWKLWIAWQTVNEVNKMKSTSAAKLKAASQEEWIQMWEEHFKNLLRNSLKVSNKPIAKIINSQPDIKLGQLTKEEHNVVLTKIKSRKGAGLNKIPPEVWKTKKFDDLLLRFCNDVYKQNTIENCTKSCILPFPNKGDHGIPKNYWGITLTSITDKIHNAQLLNHIEPEIEKILRKHQNGFQTNWSTTSQILTIHQIIEGVHAKNLKTSPLFADFFKAFDSIHRGKMEQTLVIFPKKLSQP